MGFTVEGFGFRGEYKHLYNLYWGFIVGVLPKSGFRVSGSSIAGSILSNLTVKGTCSPIAL